MKTKKYLLLLTINLIFTFGFSQGEFIVELNKTNGTYTKTGPLITDVTFIFQGESAYDENSQEFIFPSAQIANRLFSINTMNGSIVYNPLINNISKFQFDNSTNTVFGLEQDNANNIKNFISVNQVTGAYNQIGNSLPNSSTYQGFVTLDEINGNYIFLDPPNILYSLNTTNGNIVSSPNLILASGESIIDFEYNNTTGILYGLLIDTGFTFLVTIDPITGVITRIGTGTIYGTGGGTSAIDEINQLYFYLYSIGLAAYNLTTLNLSDGSLMSHTTIQGDNLDNFVNVEFDNSIGKLYSMHWDNFIEPLSINEQASTNYVIKIYPNPTNDYITIEGAYLKYKQIKIFNTLGQDLTKFVSIIESNRGKIIVDLTNLNLDLYYIKLGNTFVKVHKQ